MNRPQRKLWPVLVIKKGEARAGHGFALLGGGFYFSHHTSTWTGADSSIARNRQAFWA